MINFRALLLTLLLLIFTQSSGFAQRTLGVKWEAPESTDSAITQLQQFDEMGIPILEIQSELSPIVWQKIDSLQFEVYGSFGINYPVTSTFAQPDSTLIRTLQNRASVYLSQPSVRAIGLFEFGAVHKSNFRRSVEPIVDQIEKSGQQELYYTGNNVQKNKPGDFLLFDTEVNPKNINSLSIPTNAAIGGYIYSPSSEVKSYLTPFKKFLDATSTNATKPIFIRSSWLLPMLDHHPQFSETLQAISTEPDAVFPVPREDLPAPSSPALPIIILIGVWGTIGLHYNTGPLYRKALFRYFVAHKFFIDDIFRRQVRSVFPAFVIIVQNALLIAASGFAIFSVLLTPNGQNAFYNHFPSLAVWGNTPFSIFVWTLLAALLVSLISIIWLTIAYRKIGSFTQITTVYSWPLQLNFLFSTIAISLYAAGSSSQAIVIFTILSLLILLFSLIFTSLDTFRFAKSKLLHLTKTSIPYLLALGGLAVWILTKEEWLEVLGLSLQLK